VGALFVQSAAFGTSSARAGHPGQYWLTLDHVADQTLWRADDASRTRGVLSTRQMLGLVFGRTGNPVLGGFEASVRGRAGAIVHVRILSGRWQGGGRTMRYLVEPGPLGGAGSRDRKSPSNPVLPTRFGSVRVFLEVDPCNVNCSVINDLITLGKLVNNFFTRRNTCGAGIFNLTGEPLQWVGDSKKSEDGWSANPSRTIPYSPVPQVWPDEGGYWGWLTTSAWARGCWNNVTYKTSSGTVAIGVSDPYSGGDDWWCKTTGDLVCWHPDWLPNRKLSWMQWSSRLGGDHISAAYCIARRGRSAFPCDHPVDE
jgi:hypothetical protein